MLRSNATRRGVPKTVPFPCEIRSTAIPVKLTSQSLRGDAARLVLEDRLARDSIWVTKLSAVQPPLFLSHTHSLSHAHKHARVWS